MIDYDKHRCVGTPPVSKGVLVLWEIYPTEEAYYEQKDYEDAMEEYERYLITEDGKWNEI